MSSFDRRTLLAALAVLPMAGCNFRPVYGPGGAGGVLRNRVNVSAPRTRLEFELVARLEDRIGSGSDFDLGFDLATGRSDLAVDGADNIDRVNITGTLAFTVTERATGRVVQQGTVTTFTAYATAASPVATASALRDAEDRLAVALADQLVTRLLSGAGTWA